MIRDTMTRCPRVEHSNQTPQYSWRNRDQNWVGQDRWTTTTTTTSRTSSNNPPHAHTTTHSHPSHTWLQKAPLKKGHNIQKRGGGTCTPVPGTCAGTTPVAWHRKSQYLSYWRKLVHPPTHVPGVPVLKSLVTGSCPCGLGPPNVQCPPGGGGVMSMGTSMDATPTIHMVLYFRESHRDRQRKTEETCSKSTSSDRTSLVNIQNCRSKTHMTGFLSGFSSMFPFPLFILIM